MSKILMRLENIMTNLAGGAIALLIVLTTADTVIRYSFGGSIRGLYDFTEKYLMTVIFLGACYAYRQGAYIRLTFLVDRLPQHAVLVLNYIVQVICTAILLSYTITTAIKVFDSSVMREFIDLGFFSPPLWTAYVLLPLGGFFMFLAMFIDLWHIKSGQTGFFQNRNKEDESI